MALRPLVTNATDPQQLRRARRFEIRKQERFDQALRTVLATREGRLLLNALIADAGVFTARLEPNGSMMYFHEGRRSYGLEIRAACEAVDDEAVSVMDAERIAQAKADQREIEAGHTARAEQEHTDG
jgi:hypothetical protein